LEPAWARAAIATASPAIGTAAEEAVLAAAVPAVDGVAAAAAMNPKFGRPSAPVFAVPVALGALDDPASEEMAESPAARAAAWSVSAGAVPLA
jgi:hypothetical protein